MIAIDTSGNVSTAGSLAASTTVNPYLINYGVDWDYLFNGVNQGTTWMQPGFDASTWPSGTAELGIGDGDEATLIGPATAPTPITAYFRRVFEVNDLSNVTGLTLDVVRDDGFVVYLNGVEVARDNMPAGPVTYSTRPLTGIGAIARSEETTPVSIPLPTSVLQIGDNTIAVEMHQFNNTSNDLSFNLRLKSTIGVPPVVTVTAPANNSYVTTPSTSFAGLCSTAAGTVTVNVTGNNSATFTTPCANNEWSTSGPVADGGYDVTASQTDGSGLTGTSTPTTFMVDTSVPVVTITQPTEAAFTTSTPTISGDCVEPVGTVHVAITGTATISLNTPCTAGAWSVSPGPLGNGAYSVTASQTNGAGTTGTSAARSFQVDATAPVTTDNTASIGNAWRVASATVTLSPVDTGGAGLAQTYYSTNGTTPTTSSATGTSILLDSDGIYTIKYFSVDAFGNTEPVKTAGTQIRIDTAAPSTTDNTSAIGNAWTNANQTVTLTPADPLSGVATTYYTTNGTTPTTASTQGTSISLTVAGTYTIKYFSVDAAGNAEPVQTAGTQIRIDKTLPATTDNTAAIGNAWKTTAQTVTLTPTDTGGSGVAATYYTTDGNDPTTASAQSTSILLSTPGTFTIKYFSMDAAGNAEAVKTAATQIRIDNSLPTNTMTFPVNGGVYNSAAWGAGCPSGNRLCGTASDTGSGVASVRMSIQRSSNSQWWNGSSWQAASTSVTASGTTSWNVPLATSQLAAGITYTVTSWTIDTAGNESPNTVATFTYDNTGPTTSAANLVTANKNGAINANVDTFAVTFNEPLNPTSMPAAATLTISRSLNTTNYGISGLTNGTRTTDADGYLNSNGTSVTYAGTLVLSNNNQTVTFTVTGACAGSCGNVITTPDAGNFQYVPATTLRDLAGNAPSTSTITSSSTVLF